MSDYVRLVRLVREQLDGEGVAVFPPGFLAANLSRLTARTDEQVGAALARGVRAGVLAECSTPERVVVLSTARLARETAVTSAGWGAW